MARYAYNTSGGVGTLAGGPVTTAATTPGVTDSIVIVNEANTAVSFDLLIAGTAVTDYDVDFHSSAGRHGDSNSRTIEGSRVNLNGKASVKISGLAAGAVTLDNVTTSHGTNVASGEHIYLFLAS